MNGRFLFNFLSSVTIALLFLPLTTPTFGSSASAYKVSGVLRDNVTSAPAPNIRIFLAPQLEDGESCTLDGALTDITNESGGFNIRAVKPGRYYIFFGSATDSVEDLKHLIFPTATYKIALAHNSQTGKKLKVLAVEGRFIIKDNQLTLHGYLYVPSAKLLTFSNEGKLQYVDIKSDTTGLSYNLKPGVIK